MGTDIRDREKIPTVVFDRSIDVSITIAQEIADLIRQRHRVGKHCVLGLPTGSTPMTVYNELVRLHREEGLSFQNVITFNLDEYFPMQPDELQSYRRFMREHLFDHIDIPPANVNIPDGTINPEGVGEYCRAYERKIQECGGMDFILLGIGRTGHIGFNEPGSSRRSHTRLITLDRTTRIDAASDFFGEEFVPRRAITMGVGTILGAKRIALMALGEHKALVIARAVEGEVTESVAASFLQEHDDARIYLDRAAGEELTRYKSPWLLGQVEWDEPTIRKAVIWLARAVEKPILKLTDEHYNEHHLQDLLADHGPAYDINLRVFRHMQRTITGWPGGKPSSKRRDDDVVQSRDAVFPKRIIVFSPHPDDDVISMGGTLIRLVEQGHQVHVAYQVSGSIAVFDEDAIKFSDFGVDFCRIIGLDDPRIRELDQHIEEFLKNKQPGQVDSPEIQQMKAMIRRGEARAAGRSCGVPEKNLHFLDMPFYETGRVRKKPLSEQDVQIIVDLLHDFEPHQIYAAGDLSDPHGTHRTCLAAIIRAVQRVQNEAWFADTEMWLYRGAWQEWGPQDIDMAVPLSPLELDRKINAIFKHESQKDKALFPGTDAREFWQRAEDRNRATAVLYDQLGLAEYEAIELFRRVEDLSPWMEEEVEPATKERNPEPVHAATLD